MTSRFFFNSYWILLISGIVTAQSNQNQNWFKDRFEPPAAPVRAMAEWEEQQGVMLGYAEKGYSKAFQENFLSIVTTLQKYTQVYLMCTNAAADKIEDRLSECNIQPHNIHFLPMDTLYTVWARDYGPQSIYRQTDQSLALVDWLYDRKHLEGDDIASYYIAYYLYLTLFKTLSPPHTLLLSGANFMTDGHGTGFLNTHYRDAQPDKSETEFDETFRLFMGVDRPVKVDIGYKHLDYYFKLLNEETLLVENLPAFAREKQKTASRALQHIQTNYKSCYGRPYKIVQIPFPNVHPDLTIQTFSEDEHAYSYINSLIVNDVVFVPTYNCTTDETALQIYRKEMPGYRIVGIDCSQIAKKRGGIHCLAREIGAIEPIYISHAPLENQSESSQSYDIVAIISCKYAVERPKVFWKKSNEADFKSKKMKEIEKDIYAASIPKQPLNTIIDYYISASNVNGKEMTKPFVAPKGFWRFTISAQAPEIDKEEPKWLEKYRLIRDAAGRAPQISSMNAKSSTPKLRISQIVVKSEHTLGIIIQKLDDGDSFERLAKRYSLDNFSADKGGDLGEFDCGDLDPEIKQLVVRLKVGETCTVPLRSRAGFHIFKRTG